MNAVRALLVLAGGALAAAVAAAAVLSSMQSYFPWPRLVADGIAAGAKSSTPHPLQVRGVAVAYCRLGPRWTLSRPGAGCLEASAIGLGDCGDPPYGFLYTARNNTVSLGRCAWVLPSLEADGNRVRVTTYVPLCSQGSLFVPEAVDAGTYMWGNYALEARLVLVRC